MFRLTHLDLPLPDIGKSCFFLVAGLLSALLTFGQSDYSLTVEEHAVDGVAGMTTYRFYIDMVNTDDFLSSVYGNDESGSTGARMGRFEVVATQDDGFCVLTDSVCEICVANVAVAIPRCPCSTLEGYFIGCEGIVDDFDLVYMATYSICTTPLMEDYLDSNLHGNRGLSKVLSNQINFHPVQDLVGSEIAHLPSLIRDSWATIGMQCVPRGSESMVISSIRSVCI